MTLYAEDKCNLQLQKNKTVAYLPIAVLRFIHRKISIIVQRSDYEECDKRLLPNQTVIKGLVDLNPGYVLSSDSRKQFSNLPMVNIID